MRRRVVVTGMGGITALGEDWPTIRGRFEFGKTGVRRMPEWDRFQNLNTRLAAPIDGFDVSRRYDRKTLRAMGPVSRMAVYATERAIADAGLTGDPALTKGRMGIAYGSAFCSPETVLGFSELMGTGAFNQINATTYFHIISQKAAINI